MVSRESEPQLAAAQDKDERPAVAVETANDPPVIEEEKMPLEDINLAKDLAAGIIPPKLIERQD